MVAVAIGGAALIGGVASVVTGNKAANAAKEAATTASDTSLQIYNQQRSDFEPWRQTGVNALSKLAKLYGVGGTGSGGVTGGYRPTQGGQAGYGQFGDGQFFSDRGWTVPTPADATGTGPANDNPFGEFYASPDYQFRLQQGIKAIERSKAASGKLRSIDAVKSINNYAQGEASSEYGNYVNRLAALAGIGQSATESTANAASQYGANANNATMAAGNARASAYANTGSAINQGVSNIAAAYLYNKGYGS